MIVKINYVALNMFGIPMLSGLDSQYSIHGPYQVS